MTRQLQQPHCLVNLPIAKQKETWVDKGQEEYGSLSICSNRICVLSVWVVRLNIVFVEQFAIWVDAGRCFVVVKTFIFLSQFESKPQPRLLLPGTCHGGGLQMM